MRDASWTTSDLGWRALDRSDVTAWAALLEAIEATDRTGEHYSADDLLEELEDPALDAGRDTVAAWIDDEMIGYVAATARADGGSDDPLVVYLDAGVHPAHRGRGLGSVLGDRAVARVGEQAREAGRPSADVRANTLAADEAAERLLSRRGFEPFRFSFDMQRDLADLRDPGEPAEGAGVPAGLTAREYLPADDGDLLAAHNVAFADYPGFSGWSTQEWTQRVTGSRNFAPGHSWVVRDERGDVAAYLIAMEYDAHTAATGRRELYVAKLGTLPAHRGQGLGTALLAYAIARAAAAGYASAGLDVDSRNPSGALAIYERAGFVVTHRWRSMRAHVPAAGTASLHG